MSTTSRSGLNLGAKAFTPQLHSTGVVHANQPVATNNDPKQQQYENENVSLSLQLQVSTSCNAGQGVPHPQQQNGASQQQQQQQQQNGNVSLNQEEQGAGQATKRKYTHKPYAFGLCIAQGNSAATNSSSLSGSQAAVSNQNAAQPAQHHQNRMIASPRRVPAINCSAPPVYTAGTQGFVAAQQQQRTQFSYPLLVRFLFGGLPHHFPAGSLAAILKCRIRDWDTPENGQTAACRILLQDGDVSKLVKQLAKQEGRLYLHGRKIYRAATDEEQKLMNNAFLLIGDISKHNGENKRRFGVRHVKDPHKQLIIVYNRGTGTLTATHIVSASDRSQDRVYTVNDPDLLRRLRTWWKSRDDILNFPGLYGVLPEVPDEFKQDIFRHGTPLNFLFEHDTETCKKWELVNGKRVKKITVLRHTDKDLFHYHFAAFVFGIPTIIDRTDALWVQFSRRGIDPIHWLTFSFFVGDSTIRNDVGFQGKLINEQYDFLQQKTNFKFGCESDNRPFDEVCIDGCQTEPLPLESLFTTPESSQSLYDRNLVELMRNVLPVADLFAELRTRESAPTPSICEQRQQQQQHVAAAQPARHQVTDRVSKFRASNNDDDDHQQQHENVSLQLRNPQQQQHVAAAPPSIRASPQQQQQQDSRSFQLPLPRSRNPQNPQQQQQHVEAAQSAEHHHNQVPTPPSIRASQQQQQRDFLMKKVIEAAKKYPRVSSIVDNPDGSVSLTLSAANNTSQTTTFDLTLTEDPRGAVYYCYRNGTEERGFIFGDLEKIYLELLDKI